MPNHVKLFKIPVKIHLTLTDHGVKNNNMPFRDSDFRVYKNTFNPIEFVIRDNDRKPINLTGRGVRMIVATFPENRFVMDKHAEILDATKGNVKVTFTPNDTNNWTGATFKYTMVIDLEDGTNNLLAIDQDLHVGGSFTFISDATGLPNESKSIEILEKDFTLVSAYDNPQDTYYISSAYKADALFNDAYGIHTVAVYADCFKGKFWVQASLEESPPATQTLWFDVWLSAAQPYHEFGTHPHNQHWHPDCVPSCYHHHHHVNDHLDHNHHVHYPYPCPVHGCSYCHFSGIEPFTFEANIRWIRFKYQPINVQQISINQVEYDPQAPIGGKIHKVLYKN